MDRPHYKRLLAESRLREHMLRRELARYSAVPSWIVNLAVKVRKFKKGVDSVIGGAYTHKKGERNG